MAPVRQLTLGRVLGAPVYLRPSWFLIAGLITVVFADQVRAALPGIGAGALLVAFAYALLLLGSVFVHELAHAAAARAIGAGATHIVLDLWGGHTAFAREAASPGRSVLVAAVGPIANAVLGGCAVAALRAGPPLDGVDLLLLQAFAVANLLVAAFNALPGLPLDGGRVLEGLVWRISGSRETGMIAAGWCGRLVALATCAWAVAVPLALGDRPDPTAAVWLLLIALVLWQGASQSIAFARQRRRRPAVDAAALLRPAVVVPADRPLGEVRALAAAGAQPGGAPEIVVVDLAGQPIGVLDRTAAGRVPADRADQVGLAAVMAALPDEAVIQLVDQDALIEHVQATRRPRYVVVDGGGAVLGVVDGESLRFDLTGG